MKITFSHIHDADITDAISAIISVRARETFDVPKTSQEEAISGFKAMLKTLFADEDTLDIALSIGTEFTSRVDNQDALDALYETLEPYRLEAEKLALSLYQSHPDKYTLATLGYMAARIMCVMFIQQFYEEIVDKTFSYNELLSETSMSLLSAFVDDFEDILCFETFND